MKHGKYQCVAYAVTRETGDLGCFVAFHVKPATNTADAWDQYFKRVGHVRRPGDREAMQKKSPGLKARKFIVTISEAKE